VSSIGLNLVVCATTLPVPNFGPMVSVFVIGHAACNLTRFLHPLLCTIHQWIRCVRRHASAASFRSYIQPVWLQDPVAVAVRHMLIPDGFPCAIGETLS
jgi:hypothetical protein